MSCLNTNLKGAFNFTRAVLRAMVKQRGGRIINISSVSGLLDRRIRPNYAASKAGPRRPHQDLARELASRNITANVVAPGFIETDMTSVLSRRHQEGRARADPAGLHGRRRRHRRGSCLPRQPRGRLYYRAGSRCRRRHEHVGTNRGNPATRCQLLPAKGGSRAALFLPRPERAPDATLNSIPAESPRCFTERYTTKIELMSRQAATATETNGGGGNKPEGDGYEKDRHRNSAEQMPQNRLAGQRGEWNGARKFPDKIRV